MTIDDNHEKKTIRAAAGWFSKLDEDGKPIGARTTFAAGGVVSDEFIATATGSPTYTWTSTATGIDPSFTRSARLPVTPPPAADKSKFPRTVETPGKSPRKIVVAFLDEDENVDWCGMFWPDSVDVQHRIHEPSEMQISFKLLDANKEANE